MCNDEDLFISISKPEKPQEITLGDGYSVEATGRGAVELNMNISSDKTQRCQLYDVLYVPQLFYNLLSVAKATKTGKVFEFAQSSCSILDEKEIVVATTTKSGNLYHFNRANQKAVPAAMKCASSEDTKEHVWHRRYGHLRANSLERFARDQLVDWFDYDTSKKPSFCEPCVEEKHHRSPFPKTREERSEEFL